MNGTLDDGLPSAVSTRPVGALSTIRNVFASTTGMSFTNDIIFCPIASLAPQRLIDATQSSAVTGAPSCQSKPSRNVIVHVSLSADRSYLSIICGLIWPLASVANSVS